MKTEIRISIDKIYKKVNSIAKGGKHYENDYKKYIEDIVRNGEYSNFELMLNTNYNIDARKYNSISDLKNKSWIVILSNTESAFISRLKILYKNNNIYQTGIEIRTDNPNFIGLSMSVPLTSTYSIIGTSSGISINEDSGMIRLNLIDNQIRKFECNRITLSTDLTPDEINQIERVDSGTFSSLTQTSYKTQMNSTFGNYLVKTYKEGYTFNYIISLSQNNFLGKIEEVNSSSISNDIIYSNKKLRELTKMNKTYLLVTKNSSTDSILVYDDDPNISEEMNLYTRYKVAIDHLLN